MSLLSPLIGLSKKLQVKQLIGLDENWHEILDHVCQVYYKYEDIYLKITEAKLDIKNFFVYLNY